MGNTIIKKQNEDIYLLLLKAQRIAYSSAKNYQIIDFISIFIAITQTILTILDYAVYLKFLAVIAVFWTLIILLSDIGRKNVTKTGAIIQEQFDIELFKIERNFVLVPDLIEYDKIVSLSRKYKKKDLKNWYSNEIDNTLPYSIAILLCYKQNIDWGINLRNKFSVFLICILAIFMIPFIIQFSSKTTYDLFYYIAPSLPFLVFVVTMLRNLNENVNRYKDINKIVKDYLDKYKNNKIEPENKILRQIQDIFFIQRLNPYKVPDWFYRLYKDSINRDVDEALKLLKKSLIHDSSL